MKRIIRLSVFVFVVLLAFSRGGTGSPAVQAQGPTIRIPLNYDPPSLDLLEVGWDQNATFMLNQLFENLFRYAPDGSIVPAGATGLDISPDGTVYTIHLRTDAKWSDGEFVVAKHYIDGILRLGGTNLAFYFFPISGFEEWSAGTLDPELVGIRAIDDYTIEITLIEPTSHFIQIFASEWIRKPVRLVNASDPLGPILGEDVSNGPYQLVEWVPDDYITLVKNPNYWNSGNVEIETIQIPIIPDLFDQLEAYRNNQVDASQFPGSENSTILGDPLLSAELRQFPRPGVYYIGLNTALAPTDDINFRRALATSIDRQYLLESVLNNPWTSRATGVISPSILGYQGTAVGHPYDLVAAADYLSNVPEDPSDITVELWYNTNNFIVINTVAQMWESELGINVNLVEYDWSVYLEELDMCRNDELNPDCSYHGYRLGWIHDYLDPWNMLNDAFHPDVGTNYTHWDSAQYRNLLDLALIETDDATRIGHFQDAERILLGEPTGTEGDVAVIPLYHYDRIILIKSNINFEYPATGIAPYIMNWSFKNQSTFTVTSTEDPGIAGDNVLTLREAIDAANANLGYDAIDFDIPGAGPHTIQPTSPLPTITESVLIDGYTQPGASPNTNPPLLGTNAVLQIELSGNLASGPFVSGLHIISGNSTVRGLVINQFEQAGIYINDGDSNVIQGNFIGTDETGTVDLGNTFGVAVDVGATGNLIGGLEPSTRNVISGNDLIGVGIGGNGNSLNIVQGNLIGTDATGTSPLGNTAAGVFVMHYAEDNVIGGVNASARNIISSNGVGVVVGGNEREVTGTVVAGNFIGTDITGTSPLGNSSYGVVVQEIDSVNNLIGGLETGAGNVISSNGDAAVAIGGATETIVAGNFIGTDPTGTIPLGNGGHGIYITISQGNTIESNVIAFSSLDGVRIEDATNNTITKNSIYDNLGMGINNEGGGNIELSPPVITNHVVDRIEGTAPANSTLEFFADTNGQGRLFIGSVDAVGTSFTFFGPFWGPFITATATDPVGNTSEFSIPTPWPLDNCESNEEFAEACDSASVGFSMSSAGSFSSYIRSADDVDWFWFELPATTPPGAQVTITLAGAGGGELPANYDLVVFAETDNDPSTAPSPLQGVPLQGVPLQGVPLQGVPLQGVDAEGVPLQGVPLQGVEVRDIPLQGVPLQGVPLQGVPLQGVPLQGVPLQGVGFHSGREPEGTLSLFRNGMTGKYFVMVWSSTGEYSTTPYVVTVTTEEVTTADCSTGLGAMSPGLPIENPVADPATRETLILANTERMATLYEPVDTGFMITQVESLATHPLVNAVIVDLADPGLVDLATAYAYWDINGCDPLAANLVTLEIKKEIHQLLLTYPNIQNLVIVGNDLVIPFRRVPDEVVRTPDGATVPNEFDYQTIDEGGTLRIGSVVSENGPTAATLRLQYYLSDDFYADLAPILLDHGHELSVPDMPIGRLVETPTDISAYILGFIARGGLMDDGAGESDISAFTTGHSFMTDQATAIIEFFANKQFIPNTSLISEDWDETQFAGLFTNTLERYDVSSINTHFDHWQLAPALISDETVLINSGNLLPAAPADLSGSLLFSVGCHAGLNFHDGDAVNPADPGELDFPQALLSRGATLIGNWGFGYGDDAALAYSEELMLEFARRLGGSNIGTSFMEAKREYVLNQAILDPVHEKILMEAVFYGLPMWEINADVLPAPEGITVVETPVGPPVRTYDVSVNPGALTEISVPDRGTYYALAGRTQSALYRPIQPQASFDVTGNAGDSAHGVLFIGGTYDEITNFNPVITMPTWTHENPEPQFLYDGWDPSKIWSLAQLEMGDGSLEERLVLVPGQFLVDETQTLASGETVGTQRNYETFEFEIFYASETVEYQPPIITEVSSSVSPNPGVTFQVVVEDPPELGVPASGVAEVVITYTLTDSGSSWKSVALDETSEGIWEGTLSITDPIDFFVQAVDSSGNVGMFAASNYFTPVEVAISGPTTVVVGQPVTFATSHTLDEPAILWDFGDYAWSEGSETDGHTFILPGEYPVTVRIVDEEGNIGVGTVVIEVLDVDVLTEVLDVDPNASAQEIIQLVTENLQGIMDDNPGTPLADKVEDAIDKLQKAIEELTKSPPDNEAAVGNLEGAVGELEAIIKDELLDSHDGTYLMSWLAEVARQLAVDAIDQAIALGGDPSVISDAQNALIEGDALRASSEYKDAVNKYKDALAKAGSVG